MTLRSLKHEKRSARGTNRRIFKLLACIVLIGTFAAGVLMHKVALDAMDRFVALNVGEIAMGFLPDDIHISLLSNGTKINLRHLLLGNPKQRKRKRKRFLLDMMNGHTPLGMMAVNLSIHLQDENKTYMVGSFVDVDTRYVYDQSFHRKTKNRDGPKFWAHLNMTRSRYTDPLIEPSINTTKGYLPFTPSIQHLGVLLDAGRSYFPIPWLYHLIDLLEQLNFNLLHFRLTDDQAFNIRLDSHPELANAAWNAPTNTTVYTPDELRKLVRYASHRGIIIMPEINIPGHAGGWAGRTPGLVVPCAPFVCQTGYGLPLNISHTGIYEMIHDIIKEVMTIFSSSPYLHLGGDEVELAKACFDDVNQEMLDYNLFEEKLAEILETLQIPQSRVVRWEMTGQADVKTRVGKIPQYWFSTNYMGEPDHVEREKDAPAIDPLKRELDNNPNLTRVAPLFVSQGLYFDTNTQESGWAVYENTKRLVNVPLYEPLAVIAGTFELDPVFWLDRNVVGRLLAVAMGASNLSFGTDNFTSYYFYYCRLLDLPESICREYGIPILGENDFKQAWTHVTSGWKQNLCQRLTHTVFLAEMVTRDQERDALALTGTETFWGNFGQVSPLGEIRKHGNTSLVRSPSIFQHPAVTYTGIIIDLVSDGSYSQHRIKRLREIIDNMSWLGMNMLQLRVMNEYGFAMEMQMESNQFDDRQSLVAWNVIGDMGYKPYHSEILKELVAYAYERGIEVMPEISLATRAGGWFQTGMLTPCGETICKRGHGLTTNVTNPVFFALIYSVIADLRSVFTTSEYIHLGYDERNESKRCNYEALASPDYGKFERKLKHLLKHMNIPLDKVVRWENTEDHIYGDRAGEITHYRGSNPGLGAPLHFISTNLVMEDPDSPLHNAWDIYDYTRTLASSKPTAILAWVGSLDETKWQMTNIFGRLVAVAMGLSNETYTDAKTFNSTYSLVCVEGMPEQICSQFGQLAERDKARKALLTERQERLASSCKIRARQVSKQLPRPGFAISERHEEL